MKLPLLWLSLSLIGGILLGSLLTWSWPFWLGLAGLLLVFALAARRIRALSWLNRARWGSLPPAVLLAVVCLGAARYQAAQPVFSPGMLAWYNDQGSLSVTGVLVEPPDRRDRFTYLRLKVDDIEPSTGDTPLPAPQAVEGLLLAQVLPGGEPEGGWRYGDRLTLTGNLQTPNENADFSYRDYLARKGVYSMMSYPRLSRTGSGQGNALMAGIFALRERGEAVLASILPSPESDLLTGILLGQENGLSPELKAAYKTTGTTHIIAISGFNIAILAALFYALFSRPMGPRWGTLATALTIAIYTLLVGAGASVVRAAIMGIMGLLGRQLGRQQVGINSLAATAGIMCLFDAYMPWDIGFQLSFMATLGLVLYAQPLQSGFKTFCERFTTPANSDRIAGAADGLLMTLAAQATTLPVLLFHFGSLSLLSLAANILILPVQPLVMILGGLGLLGGLIDLSLGKLLALAAWPFAAYTNRAVEWLASVGGSANFQINDFSLALVVLAYTLLFGLTLIKDWRGAARKALTPNTLLVSFGIGAILVWSAAASMPDGRLHLVMFDAGSGEGLFIRAPGGQTLLVNGGPDATRLSQSLGRWLPPLDRRIDVLLIASSQRDSLLGLPRAINPLKVGQAYAAVEQHASQALNDLDQILVDKDIPATGLPQGGALDLGDGARLEALWVSPTGSVLLLSWREFRALLPLGLQAEDSIPEEAIPAAQVLLLPGAGLRELDPGKWVSQAGPQLILLSVSARDRQQRPDAEALAAAAKRTLLRSDQNGWVHIQTDGSQLWVEVERANGEN